ncbi:MAG: penicillin-binding protein 2 [Elusimicrobiales bacterium]
MTTVKSRINLCGYICLAGAAAVLLRLFYLQTFRHDELARKAARTGAASERQAAARGRILDREGVVLAESLRTYSCAILKKQAAKRTELVAALSAALGMPRAEIYDKWRRAENFFYVKRKLSPAEYERLNQALRAKKLEGVSVEVDYTRFYPGQDLARDIVGAVDYENAGNSGLERLYEDILGGKTPPSKALKNRYGGEAAADAGGTPGASDIYLTLDSRAQFIAESALDRAVKDAKAAGGFAVVQDPASGAVLAAASSPRGSGRSLPFQWTYEPGSTFKMVTMSAAIEKGKVNLSDTMDCGKDGKWQFNSTVTINDDEPEGELSVPDVLARSSNICSAKIALKTGLENFYPMVRAYGFGTRTSLDFPGESKGILRPPEKWKPLDLAVAGFGHGVAVTGMQLVSAYSAIAAGGVLMEPQLVDRITDNAGRVVYSARPREIRRVVSSKTAQTMNTLLRRVVEKGTGAKARIAGYTVAGKTGTARKLDENGRYSASRHVASFCGFVPASAPKFTILVVIDNPATIYGAEAAAPVFAAIAKRLLSMAAIMPEEPLPPPPAEEPRASAPKPAAQDGATPAPPAADKAKTAQPKPETPPAPPDKPKTQQAAPGQPKPPALPPAVKPPPHLPARAL